MNRPPISVGFAAPKQSRMAADHLCVPGLERPITLSDYARLEGIGEADVLAIIGQLKIPAAFFQGQWFVEAPPNCEARLAELRRGPQPNDRAKKQEATAVSGQQSLKPHQARSRPRESP